MAKNRTEVRKNHDCRTTVQVRIPIDVKPFSQKGRNWISFIATSYAVRWAMDCARRLCEIVATILGTVVGFVYIYEGMALNTQILIAFLYRNVLNGVDYIGIVVTCKEAKIVGSMNWNINTAALFQ